MFGLQCNRRFSAWTILFLIVSVSFHTSAVVLDGVEVPKEKFFFWILLGHSNAMGQGGTRITTPHPSGRAWNFYYTDEWIPAVDPIHPDRPLSSGDLKRGLGTVLTRLLAERYPDYYFGVSSTANSATGIYKYMPDYRAKLWPGLGGGDPSCSKELYPELECQMLYPETVEQTNLAQKDATLMGAIVMAGELDAFDMKCGEFASNLKMIAEGIRRDCNAPDLPFLFLEMPDCNTHPDIHCGKSGRQICEQAIVDIENTIPNSAMIPNGLCDRHCGNSQWDIIADRCAGIFEDKFGFPPELVDDSVPPTPPGAPSLVSKTATSVSLQWTASTDDIGVRGYDIISDGQVVGSVYGEKTEGGVDGLLPSTAYTFTIRARDSKNSSAQSAPVTVTTDALPDSSYLSLPGKINIAGTATGEGFVADRAWNDMASYGYVTAGQTITVTDAVSGARYDQSVYQSVRFKNFEYNIRVKNGTINVTFLFADFWRSADNQREFSIQINNTPLSTGSINVVESAGASTACEITEKVAVTNEIISIKMVSGPTDSDDAILSGIVVEEDTTQEAKFRLLNPVTGEKIARGSTYEIQWEGRKGGGFYLELSADRGKTYPYRITADNVPCCSYIWAVDTALPLTDNAVIRLFDYSITDPSKNKVYSGLFSIVNPRDVHALNGTVEILQRPRLMLNSAGGVSWVNARLSSSALLRIHDISGRVTGEYKWVGTGFTSQPVIRRNGVYPYTFTTRDGIETKGVFIKHR
jgi:hypothetical protein